MKFSNKVKYKVIYVNTSEFFPKIGIKPGDVINLLRVNKIVKNTFLVKETYPNGEFGKIYRYLILFKMNEKNSIAMVAIHCEDDIEKYEEYFNNYILKDNNEVLYRNLNFNKNIVDSLLNKRRIK
jgi:hypothetical protein